MAPAPLGAACEALFNEPHSAVSRSASCRASSAGRGWSARAIQLSEAPAFAPRCRSAVQFGCEVAACVVPSGVGGAGGGGDEAGGGAEAAAVVVVGFAFVRAAGGFMAASSAMTGSGVMTVVEAPPASPVCIELDSFTAIRTGTLCG